MGVLNMEAMEAPPTPPAEPAEPASPPAKKQLTLPFTVKTTSPTGKAEIKTNKIK